MGKITVIDKLKDFVRENSDAMDRALNAMAIDIERLSKAQVPFKKGQLKASGTHIRMGMLSYKVIYNKIYARFQEFGGDGKRVVKHYSYPGKKAHYLRDPGNEVAKRAVDYFKREVNTIRV
jgi:hypothetical protein